MSALELLVAVAVECLKLSHRNHHVSLTSEVWLCFGFVHFLESHSSFLSPQHERMKISLEDSNQEGSHENDGKLSFRATASVLPSLVRETKVPKDSR